MNYEQLDKKVKTSFLRSLSEAIGEQAGWLPLYDESTIKDELRLLSLCKILKEKMENSYGAWTNIEFEIEDKEFAALVIERINNYRKKKPTTGQLSFYTDMCKKLNESKKVPKDYLEFLYKMNHLKKRYDEEGPATDKQIEAIHSMWLKVVGEELNAPEIITRGYVNNIFTKIAEMKK